MECVPAMSLKEGTSDSYSEFVKIEQLPLSETPQACAQGISIKVEQLSSEEESNEHCEYSVPIEFVASSCKQETIDDCSNIVTVKIEEIPKESEQYNVAVEFDQTNEETPDYSYNLKDPIEPIKSSSKPKQKGNKTKNKQEYSIEKKVHTCIECGKTFKYNSILKYHMKIHSGEKYVCKHCNREFTYNANLKLHMFTHSKLKMYTCNQCDKKFTWKPTLITHIRTHTGEKPYPCTVCDKAFAQHYSFKRHMIMHSGEKPFSCDRCNKTFGCKSNLNRHLKCHMGIKRFTCTICKKKFTSKHNLTLHIGRHTEATVD